MIDHLIALLQKHNLSIVTAESCTGGLLANLLTDPAGASQWFERGFVTYSNAAKTELLQVPAELIQRVGAVSTEVAEAMASGALKNSQANLAVAITGIAGPTGGTLQKPVGTVCLAYAVSDSVESESWLLPSADRETIRQWTCQIAAIGLCRLIHH